jgi:hypothetical protein
MCGDAAFSNIRSAILPGSNIRSAILPGKLYPITRQTSTKMERQILSRILISLLLELYTSSCNRNALKQECASPRHLIPFNFRLA